MTSTTRISPTAHYTSYVWYRNGLSHPALATMFGRTLFWAVAPLNKLTKLTRGGLSLETILVRRHRLIDYLLEKAILCGDVGQVLEIGSGLSSRGSRFAERFGGDGLLYIEGDLPPIAARKRRLLKDINAPLIGHHVVDLDALVEEGPHSIEAVASQHLQPNIGTALITEGLVNYFDRATLLAMWRRLADLLDQMGGVYLSDIHLESDIPNELFARAFKRALEVFVRGKTHLHFADDVAAREALVSAGFDTAQVRNPIEFADQLQLAEMRHPDLARIISAKAT